MPSLARRLAPIAFFIVALGLALLPALAGDRSIGPIPPPPPPTTQPATAPAIIKPKPGEVAVGKLIYGNGWRDDCFSSAFLDEVGRESKIRVCRQLQPVSLAELDKLREYPMIVMSGSWRFTLPEPEVKNLREFLTKGGFLLASAHCESDTWLASFRAAMKTVFPDGKWVRLKTKHKIFQSLFKIDELRARQATDHDLSLEALMIDDRIACVLSPMGLSDTDSLPSNCCCCGANELRDAKKINANILTYVVLH